MATKLKVITDAADIVPAPTLPEFTTARPAIAHLRSVLWR